MIKFSSMYVLARLQSVAYTNRGTVSLIPVRRKMTSMTLLWSVSLSTKKEGGFIRGKVNLR
jgi:hypothetical protein